MTADILLDNQPSCIYEPQVPACL